MRVVPFLTMAFVSACSVSELPVQTAPETPLQNDQTIVVVSGAHQPPIASVTPADVTEAIFPGATSNVDLSTATQAFIDTCLTHSPDIPALIASGTALGYDMERDGSNSAFGSKFASGLATSLQINVASSYAFECAVTETASPDADDAAIRDAFFAAAGQPHTNGVGSIVLNGKEYLLTHLVFDGGAFGINEHAFLLQAN
ncbi:hypothetical protein N9O61_05015 [Octadecabacter sp.]|nr:hypothetical protein [Octadecabacter sp.]